MSQYTEAWESWCYGVWFAYWEPKCRRTKRFIQSQKWPVTAVRNETGYPEQESTALTLNKHSGTDVEFSSFLHLTENNRYKSFKNEKLDIFT